MLLHTYDAISPVPAIAPGADQASSVAAWMELAVTLATHPPGRTTILVATPGHFQALSGIRNFAAYLKERKRSSGKESASDISLTTLLANLQIKAFIGLDLSSNSSSVALVHGGHRIESAENSPFSVWADHCVRRRVREKSSKGRNDSRW